LYFEFELAYECCFARPDPGLGDVTNYTNILFATPFALPVLIPQETIDAIRAGMKMNQQEKK
jgi:hypothetical protein